MTEIPIVFECQKKRLIGMIHQANTDKSIGVLIIVGGVQTRVGSHRQFVLLARQLAEQGFTTMRFDVRGLGDSEGDYQGFEKIDDDIGAAIDYFFEICPTLKHVILWGLCDAASAALFYSHHDPRVKGLVLLNPWVFTENGAAKTVLKHYYFQRLTSQDLWQKLFCFKFDYGHSFLAFVSHIKKTLISKKTTTIDLPTRMRDFFEKFENSVLLILSGNDLTATEFKETVKSDLKWQTLLNHSRVNRYDIAEADHTFSSSEWRNQVENLTTNWLKNLTLKENV
jgi:exosortase A-associated hydrolase 1